MKQNELEIIVVPKGMIVVDKYNEKESYDSRIKRGDWFYKNEFRDIVRAEYSPDSQVSRPILASTFFIDDNIPVVKEKLLEKVLQQRRENDN